MPDITAEMRWFRSPKVEVVSFRVRKQISYKASLSRIMHSSAFSTNWCTDSVALYGSTTVSDTFGEGTTEKVSIIRSADDTASFASSYQGIKYMLAMSHWLPELSLQYAASQDGTTASANK